MPNNKAFKMPKEQAFQFPKLEFKFYEMDPW